jgi:choline-sulfatase
MERSGIGTAPYQGFDRKITETAVDWLRHHRAKARKPWVLFVSYPSPHPPFSVPERLYRLQDEAAVTLPRHYGPAERAHHPAIEHLRRIMGTREITDEAALRRITAGYLGLVAHLDEQLGQVLRELDESGLADSTRVLYTSDHGDLYGEHGLLGKSCMYEGSIGVPLLLAGAGVPAGRVEHGIASHVDLFPTVCDAVGAELAPEDADLSGRSLLASPDPARPGFAEYHAAGSASGTFMLREGPRKLVYYVGMPSQLFDLGSDPHEARDLVADGTGTAEAARLERQLRKICDPEAVDARAKADQRAMTERWGGREAVAAEGSLVFTPPPGERAEIER